MKQRTGLQGAIEAVYDVIAEREPLTAREIERDPRVISACRSSKLKARRLIERLEKLGHIKSDGAEQMPKFSTIAPGEPYPEAADPTKLVSAEVPTRLISQRSGFLP